MRIAYITADFGVPVLGTKGASAHVRGLVQSLRRLGSDVFVLAANLGGDADNAADFPLSEVPIGASLTELCTALKEEQICGGNRLAKDLRNILYALSLEMQGRVALQSFQPDVIYERYCLFSTAGLELARYFRVPFILEVNAPLVLEQQEMRGLSLPLVASAAEHLLQTKADHVVVVSDHLRNYVTGHGIDTTRVTVIPNAADPQQFSPRSAPSLLRWRLGWEENVVIGFVGSMKPWHGIPTLLQALHLLGGSTSRFRLLLVGSGPELPAIRWQIDRLGLADCVHLTGAQPHDCVPDAIHAMDVAVAPYSADANAYFSPLKLFEYMAMAVPVVAARMGQVCEVVEDGRTGWLYPPGDAAELSAVIRRLAAQPQLCREAGAAARERVLTHHTWQQNAQRVLNIAEELIREKKSESRVPSASLTPSSAPLARIGQA
jgi:glycosyltransferase involved in cell wall biosynthesis